MKYLPILILSLFLTSCANSTTEKPEDNHQKRKFLWTAEWTNGVQENPEDMTKTVYTFLTTTDNKNAVCEKENLTINSVYKETWINDNTAEKPVWSLQKDKTEVLNYDQVATIVCENKDADYGVMDLETFDYSLDRYPLFQVKNL